MLDGQISPDVPHLNPAKDVIDGMEDGLDKLDEGLDSVLELLYLLEKLFPDNKYIRRAIDIVILLKSLIQPLQNSLKSLQFIWDLNDTLYRNLQADYQKQSQTLADTQSELQTTKSQLDKAQADLADYQQLLTEAREENHQLHQENVKLKYDNKVLQAGIEELNQQVSDLGDEVRSLTQQNKQLQQEKDQALNDALVLRAQLEQEEASHASDIVLLRQAANIIVGAGNMNANHSYYGYITQGSDYTLSTANSSGSEIQLYLNESPNAVTTPLLFSTGATAVFLADPHMTLFQFSGGYIPIVEPRTIGYALQFCGLIKQRWPGEFFQA